MTTSPLIDIKTTLKKWKPRVYAANRKMNDLARELDIEESYLSLIIRTGRTSLYLLETGERILHKWESESVA